LIYINGGGAARLHRAVMHITLLVARVLMSAIFVLAAPRHFTDEGARHAADLGVPLASIAVPLSGVLALVGGIGVLIGYQTRWSAIALIAFLVPVTLGMHGFWRLSDPMQIHIQRAMFMKNLAMIGGALALTVAGAGKLSLDGWLER
jgi:putative oxidoreductase